MYILQGIFTGEEREGARFGTLELQRLDHLFRQIARKRKALQSILHTDQPRASGICRIGGIDVRIKREQRRGVRYDGTLDEMNVVFA